MNCTCLICSCSCANSPSAQTCTRIRWQYACYNETDPNVLYHNVWHSCTGNKNLCKFLFHAYALYAHAPVQTCLRLEHAPAFAGNMHFITKLTQMFYIMVYGTAAQA